MSRGRSAGSNRGPSDQQILSAMRSVHAKSGPVHCLKYSDRLDLADSEAANSLADAVTKQDCNRLAADDYDQSEGQQVSLADHITLRR